MIAAQKRSSTGEGPQLRSSGARLKLHCAAGQTRPSAGGWPKVVARHSHTRDWRWHTYLAADSKQAGLARLEAARLRPTSLPTGEELQSADDRLACVCVCRAPQLHIHACVCRQKVCPSWKEQLLSRSGGRLADTHWSPAAKRVHWNCSERKTGRQMSRRRMCAGRLATAYGRARLTGEYRARLASERERPSQRDRRADGQVAGQSGSARVAHWVCVWRARCCRRLSVSAHKVGQQKQQVV